MLFIFEYKLLLIFLIIVVIIALIVFSISYILVLRKRDFEKITAYECGFNPFGDSRNKFDVRFYLVGILFIVFDLELMFLFPWAIMLEYIGMLGFWIGFIFIVILTIGFFYEWFSGALEWE